VCGGGGVFGGVVWIGIQIVVVTDIYHIY